MDTARCGNICRQKCDAKGSRKKNKLKYRRICRGTMDVEHEMYDYTGNNWSHWNIKVLKKNLEAVP